MTLPVNPDPAGLAVEPVFWSVAGVGLAGGIALVVAAEVVAADLQDQQNHGKDQHRKLLPKSFQRSLCHVHANLNATK